jgi:hypothetical protein
MDWKTGEILFTQHLSADQIKQVVQIIQPLNLSFTIHKPIPNTHSFIILKTGTLTTIYYNMPTITSLVETITDRMRH